MAGVVVVGAGPGIGAAVARRFAAAGLPVGLVARTEQTLEATRRTFAAEVTVRGVAADASDEPGLRGALETLESELGVPDVLVYNAARIRFDSLGDLSAAEHLRSWSVNVVGAVTAAAHVLPRMAARGSGTMLITGGMPEPLPGVLSLSLGKAGVRALTEALDAQYRPRGVHVATVTVGGPVAPGTAFDPDVIAAEYLRLHQQPREAWQTRIDFAGRDVRV